MNILLLESGTKAGNANADFVVPSGNVHYQINYGQVILTTDATVANRQLDLQILDDAGTPALVFDTHAGTTVPASQTGRHFELMPGTYRETSFVGGSLQCPFPDDFVVKAGWTIRVKFTAGVAGDSYTVKLVVTEYGSRAR